MYDAVALASARRVAEAAGPRELDLQTAAAAPVISRTVAQALAPVLQSLANGVEREPATPTPSPGPGSGTGSDPLPPEPAERGGGVGGRPNLDGVLRDYQAKDDEEVTWRPKADLGPIRVIINVRVDAREVTKTEAELLDKLGHDRGLLGLKKFEEISSNDEKKPGLAYRTADEYFPPVDGNGKTVPGKNDGHNDAFRHAYWNALMTKHFGEEFAAAMGTAHEGKPGNLADREAMDLYNNELGRRIALENPDASEEELARLVYEAVQNGEAVGIDRGGELAWSDQVAVGKTGVYDDPPAEGVIKPRNDPDIRPSS